MSELSDKALEQIQKAVITQILTDKAGNEYTTRPVHFIEPRVQPAPDTLKISTLTGIVEFCTQYGETMEGEDPSMIHVLTHADVRVYSEPFGPAQQRTLFLVAAFESLLGTSFTFGQFYEQENFIVGLQSLFEPTPQREEVLKVIGTIKESQVRESSDDGVTQAVSAKAGIALVTDVAVPNPVILRPYRTFREIEQPESAFVLRVRSGREGGKPLCALFEADGGRWKLDAIQRIADFLTRQTKLTILA